MANQPHSQEKRKDWVDLARGVGIILMVYGHVYRGLVASGIGGTSPLLVFVDDFIYTFHMPLFLFLSGYFLPSSFLKRGAANYIFNKIDTLGYSYLVWSAFYILIIGLLPGHANNEIRLVQLLHILTTPVLHFWFLYALFLVSVVGALALRIFSIRAIPAIWLVAVGMFIFQTHPPGFDFIFRHINNHLGIFMFGAFFSLYLESGGWLGAGRLFWLTLSFVFVQGVCHLIVLPDAAWSYAVAFLATAISVLTVVLWCRKISPNFSLRWLRFVGSASLCIYIFHIIIISGLRIILGNILQVRSFGVHLFLGCAAGIIVPVLLQMIVQKRNIKWVFALPISLPLQSLLGKIDKSAKSTQTDSGTPPGRH